MTARRKSCRLPEGEECTAKPRGRCFRCAPRTDDERARNAAAVKANWQDPEFRARNAAATKAANSVWPDCPDHLRDDYETLRHYMSATEARATLDPGFTA